MLEEFVSLGKWWLPNNPEVEVPGKLSFSSENGATLELLGSFYSSPFEEIGDILNSSSLTKSLNVNNNVQAGVAIDFIKPKETIILGLLDNNEEISLYRCSGEINKYEFSTERATLVFYIEYIFRKIHFNKEEDIQFKSISVQYSNLREWVGKSGIEIIPGKEENQVLISYQPPSNIHIAKIENLDLNITFSQVYFNPFNFFSKREYYRANLEQIVWLTMENPCNQPFNECIQLLINFRDLLSFAMTKPTSVIEVSGRTNVTYTKGVLQASGKIVLEEEQRETQVFILFSLGNSAKAVEIEIPTNKMLFLFRDLENNLGEIFEAWINKREEYQPIFDLLLITMYTPNLYLHYRFLNVVQALEAYHTNKYEDIYQDVKIYEKGLYKKFREVLDAFPSKNVDQENGISDEFRKALKGKLKAQTRFTLETRLKDLLKKVSPLLPNDFIGSTTDRDSFARRSAETRNALTHHDKEKRKQAAQGQELNQLFYTLKVILQICLMKEISFNDNSIKTLVERNRVYQDEWKP